MTECINCGETNAEIKLEDSHDWWHCVEQYPDSFLCNECNDRDILTSKTEGRFEYSTDMIHLIIALEEENEQLKNEIENLNWTMKLHRCTDEGYNDMEKRFLKKMKLKKIIKRLCMIIKKHGKN